MMLSGWGRYPVLDCRVETCRDPAEARSRVTDHGSTIARGMGRAYGDAALNPTRTLSMLGSDRFRAFDPASGLLTCEAGTRLSEILSVFVPRGWFPPVVPGTKFVSVGGMIAADVHGKNHHRDGAFGNHVTSLDLALADGSVVTCSRSANPELFAATIGGMGLTGVILRATVRMVPVETAYLASETRAAGDLDTAMGLLAESDAWPYTVAWIDCLATGRAKGRSLIYRGRHAARDELPMGRRESPLPTHRDGGLTVPVDMPGVALNGLTVRAFNAAYYAKGRAGAGGDAQLVHYDPFFFPLDGIHAWNRLYGRRGFVQYQCVLPDAASRDGLAALLDRIAAAGQGSFLAVLKRLGAGTDFLSFPMAGYTLALDFPVRAGTFALLDALDAIVAEHGGRVYLAKDARTAPGRFAEGYPDLQRFRTLRGQVHAPGRFESLLSRRLEI
jgi:FAD/FMN-containing dehydrogenase